MKHNFFFFYKKTKNFIGSVGIQQTKIFLGLALQLIFIYKFQIKLPLSIVICAILAFFNHPVAHKDLERNSKEWNCPLPGFPLPIAIVAKCEEKLFLAQKKHHLAKTSGEKKSPHKKITDQLTPVH